VGDDFLRWLAADADLRWLDVGCGNGAFTEMVVERCAPISVDGIDPSVEQIAYACTRPASRLARFHQGDAMALPFPDDAFEVAVMPLVIFFVPDPAVGVAEMSRVVRPGGTVASYGWDLLGGGLPYESLLDEFEAMGVVVPKPPSPGASGLEELRAFWKGAGLESIETRVISVERTFSNFEEYWAIVQMSPSSSRIFSAMAPEDFARLEQRMRQRLPVDASGRITYGAKANAIQGRVPRGS
jgi:ubiquinone/menaquinone biosynthesis C-methylase UbiE